ncbi:ComEC/Rec2 family competence protein (plasmid) [Brevundimonas staleyi]|uniref:ComEC/Rec2 family competence protein n=1 Tax=Brevundimonas staleyi TaxID=74326 RepID=A0ABW0FPX1_9CAUL
MTGFRLSKRALLRLAVASAAAGTADAALARIASAADEADVPGRPLLPWRPGELLIHHISTGRGNAAYIVAPDATTLLLDAGEIAEATADRFRPLKLAPARPDASRSAGAWIVRYIESAAPTGARSIDYAVISHFHGDHFGDVKAARERSAAGDIALTGITEVGERLPIRLLLDRAYPDYASLTAAGAAVDPTLANYARFVSARAAAGLMTAQLRPDAADQIRLLNQPRRYPTFAVDVVKAGAELADGNGRTRDLRVEAGTPVLPENALSAALTLTYGRFRYFAGGDNTGVNEPAGRLTDVETPMAAAVGPVDVMSLNHHGGRDANNPAFLSALNPQIVVEQSYMSDQPGQELVRRLVEMRRAGTLRDAFATSTLAETEVYIGPPLARAFTSLNGHVVVRVASGGDGFRILVLDDTAPGLTVRSVHGPYLSGREISAS